MMSFEKGKEADTPTNNIQSSNTIKNPERFSYVNQGPVYHDLWATVLFIVHFLAFIIVGSIGINKFSQDSKNYNQNSTSAETDQDVDVPPMLATNFAISMIIGSIIATVLSSAYVIMMRKYPIQLIRVSFWFGIGLLAVCFLFCLIFLDPVGKILGTIAFGLAIALSLLYWYCVQNRIAFVAMILETIVSVYEMFPSCYYLVAFNTFIAFMYHIWWAYSMSGAVSYFNSGIVNLFLIFSLYWVNQVLKNTIFVTLSGIFSSWYFLFGTSAMPPNPVVGAIYRSYTTSFGPIALGSLIIAILQTIKFLLKEASRRHQILAAITICLLDCIEGLVAWINSYAFVYVSIYGKGFCDSAKDVFNLLSAAGFQAVANDNLISSVLGFGGFCVGLVSAATGFCYMLIAYAGQHQYFNVVLGVGILSAIFLFFVGFFLMGIVGEVIMAGEKTLFVCLIEDPSTLGRTKPELLQKLKERYPQVAWRF